MTFPLHICSAWRICLCHKLQGRASSGPLQQWSRPERLPGVSLMPRHLLEGHEARVANNTRFCFSGWDQLGIERLHSQGIQRLIAQPREIKLAVSQMYSEIMYALLQTSEMKLQLCMRSILDYLAFTQFCLFGICWKCSKVNLSWLQVFSPPFSIPTSLNLTIC